MLPTTFAKILRRAVEQIPGAIGGALAATDGELVDAHTEMERYQWQVITAHYGIALAQIQSALMTLHFGTAESVIIQHERMALVISVVAQDYYALIAIRGSTGLAKALSTLERSIQELREEMF